MNEKQYSAKSVSMVLLCCPFCGNEPDFTESASANNETIITFGVVCDNCGISLSANCVSLTIAGNYWNTRTHDAEIDGGQTKSVMTIPKG